LACETNAGEGGKTRFSCATDSMLDMGIVSWASYAVGKLGLPLFGAV
jgi:hypothetical protein